MEEQVKDLIKEVADIKKTLSSAYSLLETLTSDVMKMQQEIDVIKSNNQVDHVTAATSQEDEVMKLFGLGGKQ